MITENLAIIFGTMVPVAIVAVVFVSFAMVAKVLITTLENIIINWRNKK